ncbi:Serine carboxypeptidase-like [Thalictrum thalictroides]|uniref:Serine carboxypeptidase-like n=1 Tax=Thalictrum thalictroides TaxID=46969 RepID=A0A7J6WC11_THATH|nr:Serine carboxypeptidase-like [Thalictrum thalictroides]
MLFQIGNALINDNDNTLGMYNYFWTHALNSDETYREILEYCVLDFSSDKCSAAQGKGASERGGVDIYNIYAPLCHDSEFNNNVSTGSIKEFDPCSDDYVSAYLNLPEVQDAFHAKNTSWFECSATDYYIASLHLLIVSKSIANRFELHSIAIFKIKGWRYNLGLQRT